MSQRVIKLATLHFPFLQRAPEGGIKTIMLLFMLQTSSGSIVNLRPTPAFFNLEA